METSLSRAPSAPVRGASSSASVLNRSTNVLQNTYNPVYPSYLSPKHQQTPPITPPRRKESEDDVELLRKYGLDQFTLDDSNRTSESSTSHTSSQNNSSLAQRDRKDWTIFD